MIAFESTRDGRLTALFAPDRWRRAAEAHDDFDGRGAGDVVARRERALAFVSAVFPEFSAKPFKESDKANKEKQDARDKSKVKARLRQAALPPLGFVGRDKRQHLFVMPIAADGTAGEPRDVHRARTTPCDLEHVQRGPNDFAWAARRKEIAFTAPPAVLREQAWSTNHSNIWTVNSRPAKNCK